MQIQGLVNGIQNRVDGEREREKERERKREREREREREKREREREIFMQYDFERIVRSAIILQRI